MNAAELTPGTDVTVSARRSWELVAAAQAGDTDAFGQLYARYRAQVEGFISRRIVDWADAQDLTSETFTRAWARIGSVSDQGHGKDVGAWFTTIARNLVVDRAKSARVRYEVPTRALPEQHTEQQAGPEQRFETNAERAERARRLARWADGLTPVQRECLDKRFAEELNLAQTAALMGRSVTAVKALQHRALDTLRAAAATDTDPAATVGGQVVAEVRSSVRRAHRAAAQARVPEPRHELDETHHHHDQHQPGQDSRCDCGDDVGVVAG